ncbi:MAG: HlyC/CorC family transporter [Pseudonocardiales bacterium]|nr:HlyC/CorC family transporter [Pseudonocardiales bacterium]
MGSDVLALVAAVLLVAANAFFVGAEFALITARRDRLEALADAGKTRASKVLKAASQLSEMIAGAQLGITVCSLLLGRLGEPAVASLLEAPLAPLGLPEAVLHGISFAVALTIVVVAHVLLGEMVPKNVALAGPESAAMVLVPSLVTFVRLTRPLVVVFNMAAAGLLHLIHVQPRDELESAYTPGELAEMIADSRREGLLDDDESSRLSRALGSSERTVADAMAPIDELVTLPAMPTVAQVVQAVSATGFSRFPLRDDDGELVGYLHVKDILDVADQPEAIIPRDRMRALPDVPVTARSADALATLRRSQAHLARVVNARGRTVGVVAMEDLLEYYLGSVDPAGPGRSGVQL